MFFTEGQKEQLSIHMNNGCVLYTNCLGLNLKWVWVQSEKG